jgi:sucrose-6-phosphate hydrolase SacC (GH32 family)
MKQLKLAHIILVASCCMLLFNSCNKKVFLFTSFKEPASGGLGLLYSADGYHWNRLDTILLKPNIGVSAQKIMRDPSIIQGPDGLFHLVFTTEWKGGNGFGYAHSKDLIHWSEQQYIPVMQSEKTVVNVWAPELFYDETKKQYIIVWASCIPNRFEKGIEDENNNHRLYYTMTKDFISFTETKLFFDPKFSVIDATIVKRGNADYVLVLKDNTRPERNIKLAFATSAYGPYTNVSAPITNHFSEGPSAIKIKNDWLIYFDA